jgi:hypothetical protein
MRRQWVAVSIAVGVIAGSVLLCASGGRAPSETTPVNKATGHVLGRCSKYKSCRNKSGRIRVAQHCLDYGEARSPYNAYPY